MAQLSGEELSCLRALAGPAQRPLQPCPTMLLEGLRRRGLVELQQTLCLPLGNPTCHYTLSPSGQRLLAQLKG